MPAPAALTAVLAAGASHPGGSTVGNPRVGYPGAANPAATSSGRTPTSVNPAAGLDPRAVAGPPGRGAPPSPSKRGRRRRGPGLLVLGLVLVGAAVAAVLLTVRPDRSTSGGGGGGGATSHRIASVSPFMLSGRPDDPQGLPYLYDGNTATYWHTDQYRTAAFGNLYPGLGLAIQLSASGTVHHLIVTSPTTGWAAQTYVSTTAVASGQPVSAWGHPTDTRTGISGSATFNLAGPAGSMGPAVAHSSSAAGPPFQVSINEITVT